MTNKIQSVGITDFTPELAEYEKTIAKEYYEQNNITNEITRDEFILGVANAMGLAASAAEVKNLNKKINLTSPLIKVEKHLASLINALNEIDGYGLQCLQTNINSQRDYLGYAAVKPLKSPQEYVANTLEPQLEIIQLSLKEISSSPPLKKQRWKIDLVIQLLTLHHKITGELPSIYRTGTEGRKPAFYDFCENVTFHQELDSSSEQSICEALQELRCVD